MPPRDKILDPLHWQQSGALTERQILHSFCSSRVRTCDGNEWESSNPLFSAPKVHSAITKVMCEFAYWADFALSPPSYPGTLPLPSPHYLYPPTHTFKCVFYQSHSWTAAESCKGAKKKKPIASPLSSSIWLLLSRPVFPREAARLCLSLGLLKLLPCYPLSQHWTPSHGPASKNGRWKKENLSFVQYTGFFSLLMSDVGWLIHLN